jgi:hypothetical protein
LILIRRNSKICKNMNRVKALVDEENANPLSDTEVLNELRKMGNINANLVTYPEIKNYRTLDQLLGPSGVCVILYLWKEGYGHWVCVTKHENLIEYFDSYGKFPDVYLDEIPEPFRSQSGQTEASLSKLMKESPYDLSYNEYPFQKEADDISTCGKWVIVRALLREITLEQFKDLFLGKYGDDIVTILTS